MERPDQLGEDASALFVAFEMVAGGQDACRLTGVATPFAGAMRDRSWCFDTELRAETLTNCHAVDRQSVMLLTMDFRALCLASLLVACGALLHAQSPVQGLARTHDVDIAYEQLGSDRSLPPIIAVNGGPGITHAYMVQNDLWQQVAAHRTVVFYDQRGVGRSIRLLPDAPQTLEAQIADLDAVRAALHTDRVDLVGDSYGGFLVLAYTLVHPDHVRRLVVSDGLPGWKTMVHPMPDMFPDLEARDEAHLKTMPKGAAADDYSMRAHLRKCFVNPAIAERFITNLKDIGLNSNVQERVYTAAENVDLSPKLPTIHAPTLILTGRYDVNVAPITAWRMAQAIPHAQFHAFEQSGHEPFYEEPEAYRKTLTDFLNSR